MADVLAATGTTEVPTTQVPQPRATEASGAGWPQESGSRRDATWFWDVQACAWRRRTQT